MQKKSKGAFINGSSVIGLAGDEFFDRLEQFPDQVCSGFRIRIAVKTNS